MTGRSAADLSEEELVGQSQAGNPAAFTELMKRNKEKSVQTAYVVIGNYEDAKDIAQEAFIKAYHAIRKFDGRSKFMTWFYRILINTAKDHIRKKKMSRWVRFQNDDEKTDFLERTEDPNQKTDAGVMREEMRLKIQEAIRELPEKQRWLFTLRYLEGLSIAEICQATGSAEGTVKSALHFAAQKFKDRIQPYVQK